MAAVEAIASKRPFEEIAEPDVLPRKRFKISELPLSSTKKSTIDGLIHKIKKKGSYDNLRRKVWTLFDQAVSPCLLYVTAFSRRAPI